MYAQPQMMQQPMGMPMQQRGMPQQFGAVPTQYMQPQMAAPQQQVGQLGAPGMPVSMPQAIYQGMPRPMLQPMPQAMPQRMQQPMPQPMQTIQQAMPQPIPQAMPQPMQQPMPQAMPQAAPQAMPTQMVNQPIQAMPQPTIRAYTPEGGEMLQITVMGTKQLPVQQCTVHIQVPGKHDFLVETQPIVGVTLQPKTTVTYIQPGDGLIFSVTEGDQVLGQTEITSHDFYPGGFEGDIPIAGGAIAVKITPLGAGGQIQQLPPVTVQQPRAPVQASDPVVVGGGAMRHCSPEEFQFLSSQPGAAPMQVMTPEEMQASGLQAMGVPQPMMPQ